MPALGVLAAVACLQAALPTGDQLKKAGLPEESHVLDSLRPAGWSKDGKFAYFEEDQYNDSDDLFQIVLVIQDLKTGHEPLRREYSASALKKKKKDPAKGFLDAFTEYWKKHGAETTKELKKAGIELCKGTAFATFPLKKGDDSFHAALALSGKRDTRMPFEADSPPSHVSIRLVSNAQGEKTVLDDPKANVWGAYVAGYFESPFDGRIAIVWEGETTGFEGPPNVLKPSLVGAELKGGFKK